MRTLTPATALLLVTVSLALPAGLAAEVHPGTIYLSSTLLHHEDTLFVNTTLASVSGTVTSLTFVFQGNGTAQVVNVSDNLTNVNSWYRVQHFFDGSEAFDHYVLQAVIACDDDGCATDTTNLTGPDGRVPAFDLVKRPAPPPPGRPDLVATGVFAPFNATEGDTVFLSGSYANLGNASASNFTVALYVDSFLVGQQYVPFLAPGENGTIATYWNASAGWHALALVVDDKNDVGESNESNNKASTSFFVQPRPLFADLGIDIRGVTHERLRTEAGDLPHPAPRHTIHLAVTNDGDEGSLARIDLSATAQTRFVPIGTTSHIATLWVFVPAHGIVSLQHVWEPTTTLGDVTIHAHVESWSHVDPNPANDHDTASGFVIVGGLGGLTR